MLEHAAQFIVNLYGLFGDHVNGVMNSSIFQNENNCFTYLLSQSFILFDCKELFSSSEMNGWHKVPTLLKIVIILVISFLVMGLMNMNSVSKLIH